MAERPIYQTSTFTLAAGVETSFQAHRYLRILTTTGPVTLVSSMANDFGPAGAVLPACVQVQGVRLADGSVGEIGPVRFRNDGGAPITFTVATSNAPVDDSRDLNGTGGTVTIGGVPTVQGAAADGAAPSGNPVLMAGSDGAAVRSLKTDTTGRIQSSSAGAAEGAAATGNPLRIGGWDGTNIFTIKTDASGFIRCRVTDGTNHMPTMDAAARRGYQQITDGTNLMPTMDAGARRGYQQITDGTTAVTVIAATAALKTDLSSVAGTATVTAGVSGLQAVGGNVASGSALAGNPVRVAGSDGTNVQNIRAQADNSTLPTAGNPTAIPGYYSSSARGLTSGNVGFLTIDRGGKQVCVPGGTLDPVILGYTVSTLQAAATTNATSVKAAAGMVYEVSAVNQAAYDVFIRLYNKASAPTVGTDVAYRVIRVPAGQSVAITFPGGAYFSTGIAFATTKLVAYNDTTALAANDCQLSVQYS